MEDASAVARSVEYPATVRQLSIDFKSYALSSTRSQLAPQNVSALSREAKVEQAILRGVRLLPADVGAQLKAYLSPGSLAIMVATLVGLAVAQAFGIGELADALLLIAGVGFCGWGAVSGCSDLYHFVKTALGARSEQDLNDAARYFASAVVKIGVTALMAFLLKKPLRSFRDAGGLKSFKTMNYKPNLRPVNPPPAPGTSVAIQYQKLDPRFAGFASPYGDIIVNSSLKDADAKITIDHELVHRFFAPKLAPFRQLRASIAQSGYFRSAMLRYLEEAFAEGYALVRAQGYRGIIKGIKFPLDPRLKYISIAQKEAMRGQFLGVIIVDGQVMTVSLESGLQQDDQQQSQSTPTK